MDTSQGSGYWEPHSSSVDFCEANYLHGKIVAEPHNAWSSLVFVAFGVVGALHRPGCQERMFLLPHLVLISIGLGSAAFHSTLHWFWQSTDEVPMLWLNMSHLYILVVIHIESGILGANQNKNALMQWTALVFWLITICYTFFYYSYRAFYAVFLVTFSITTTAIILWTAYMVFVRNDRKLDNLQLQLWKCAFTSFVAFGFVPWVIDMNLCGRLDTYYNSLPGFFKGWTLHILWHISSGYGAHLLNQLLQCQWIRLHEQIVKEKYGKEASQHHKDRGVRLSWVMWFIPVLDIQQGCFSTGKPNDWEKMVMIKSAGLFEREGSNINNNCMKNLFFGLTFLGQSILSLCASYFFPGYSSSN